MRQSSWFQTLIIFAVLSGMLMFFAYTNRVSNRSLFCFTKAFQRSSTGDSSQLRAIVHYATSSTVPQQSLVEIRETLGVLRRQSPCNFLVFGLGHDSIMWDSLNSGGTTVFLEEDPKWFQSVMAGAPWLNGFTVNYRTQLSQADDLLKSYRSNPSCSPQSVDSPHWLRNNVGCPLALNMLPQEIYETQWDLIMIDAPKGYFDTAPGRMAAIYTVAVLAKIRSSSDTTHVFLHDVNRRVERMYAEEFLCKKYLVKSVGRLWHFEIPSAQNSTEQPWFC